MADGRRFRILAYDSYDVFDAGQGPILDYGLQLLKRSTAVPDDPDHPARRWFQRWSLWPPVLELPPWIRWVQASPAYLDHPIAGALIAAAAPLEPWIWLTPSFPKHVISGVHLVPIGPEGQSALDRDPEDEDRKAEHEQRQHLGNTGNVGPHAKAANPGVERWAR